MISFPYCTGDRMSVVCVAYRFVSSDAQTLRVETTCNDPFTGPLASECELLPFSSRSSLVASLALRRQPARTHCMLSRTTEHDRRLELRAFVAALLMRRGPKRRHKSVMLVHSTKTRPRVSCVACTTASGWHRGPLYGARLTSATGLRWPSSHTVSSFRQQM